MMLVENQYFEVKISKANIEWYNFKGYDCNLRDNITVKAEDLTKGSHSIVNIKCDYCGEQSKKQFQGHYRDNISGIIHKDSCKKCYPIKVKESNLLKYGVENVKQLEWVKEKSIETNIEKYGAEYYMQTEEFLYKVKQSNMEKYGVESVAQVQHVKDKMRETNLERLGVPYPTMSKNVMVKVQNTNFKKYGVIWGLQNSEIREKSAITNIEKYGFANPFQNEAIKEKIKDTNIIKYGVENPSQSIEIKKKKETTLLKNWGVKHGMHNPIIKAKVRKTLYKNGNTPTSKQQNYLCDLLEGELNYNIGNYSADILLDDKIIVEYNGGGHDLQVKLGNMTEDEFLNKERRRTYFLRRSGYKVIKIISPNDYLASDEEILKVIKLAKEHFELDHSLYIIDFGDKINNDTYGKLRRIS